MTNLFSQIPAQVLNRVNIYKFTNEEDVAPKKRVKFDERVSVKSAALSEDSFTDTEINIEDSSNEPTSSLDPKPNKERTKKQCSDAIIQTVKVELRSIATQTDESMTTRPLADGDVHRMNMQTFTPIRPIPKRRNGQEPPLRIGMTKPRGRPRRVFYPGEGGDTPNADGT